KYPQVADIKINNKAPGALKTAAEGSLVAARGGTLKFEGEDGKVVTDESEREAFAIEKANELFGVKTLRDLGALCTDVGRQVNAILRKEDLAEQMRAKGAGGEKPYFPKPDNA